MTLYQVKVSSIAVFCCMMGIATSAATAATPGEIVRQGKLATAMVDIGGHAFATAFCIDKAGIFVTNQHVVREAQHAPILLVLNAGEADQKVLSAEVLSFDLVADLAVLRANSKDALPFLELGSDKDLVETDAVTAFGYPFGTRLGVRGQYPSVTVSTGHVTSLRKESGELAHIQIDALVNPGNSGGPVLNAEGKVIGIVASGVPGSGVNFAVPVEKLSRLLGTPQIVFAPDPIPFAERHKPRNFLVRVSTTRRNTNEPLAVELTLRCEDHPEQKIKAVREGDAYRATAVPVPDQGAVKLRFSADFPTGAISGTVIDLPLTVGTKKLQLAEIRSIRHVAEKVNITLVDGSTVQGELGGLGMSSVDFGGITSRLDLSKATSLELELANADPQRIAYTVTVAQKGVVVTESSGTIQLVREPTTAPTAEVPAESPIATVAPRPAEDRVEVKLPSTVDEVTRAAGGRLLVLTLRKLGKLAIFDAGARQITHYIPIPLTGGVIVAAGSEKLVVILVDEKVIQVWSLRTFTRLVSAPLPIDGTVSAASMGCASDGPLLVRWSTGSQPVDPAPLAFIDINTLKTLGGKMQVGGNQIGMANARVHIRASANGDAFGIWNSGQSPSGLGLITVAGGEATMRWEHEEVGFVQPGPDAAAVFTAKGAFTPRLQKLSGSPGDYRSNIACFPAAVPGYYIAQPLHFANRVQRDLPPEIGSLYMTGGDRPVTTVPDLSEIGLVIQFAADDFSMDKRVHFLPDLDLIITVAAANDVLVLHRFNVVEALDRRGIDYLFVASVPPNKAKSDEVYRYPLDIKSKRGGVKVKIESGPDGMTVSPGNVVLWRIPPDARDTSVILSISDVSGQEIYHTFQINVR